MPTSPTAHVPERLAADRPRVALGGLPLWGGLLACVAMFAYSWYGDHFQYVTDDAGIFLRYAERIAAGGGFAYNEGEAVNGCSSPLFVLVEAALLRAGLAPSTVVLLIASVCLAATAGLLFETFARFYSLGAALFAVVALVAFNSPFDTVVDGMETPVVIVLAALLFRTLHGGGWLLPGLALGCLVANKLDGALAALAFTAVHLAARRRFPWREAATAALAVVPIAALLAASFGTLVPNSLTVKLLMHSAYWRLKPLWMHDYLSTGGFRILYAGAWLSLAWLPLSRALRGSFAIAVVQAWFVLHMVAFASINLGGPYPWYATVPTILSVILAAFVAHVAARAVVVRTPVPRLALDPQRIPRRARPVAAALVVGLGLLGWRTIAMRVQAPSAPHSLARYSSDNLGRQAAGAWLRAHTDGKERLVTFEGLPAYEYGGPCYDFSLLNSRPDQARLKSAAYYLAGPLGVEEERAQHREGRVLVATFQYDAASGPYLLYAAPRSEIAAAGARHLVLPVRAAQGATRHGVEINAWSIPAGGSAVLEVAAPGPPTLLLRPELAREHGPANAGERATFVIRCGKVELARRELRAGERPAPLRVAAPAAAADGRYAFEIECIADGGDAAGLNLVLREVLARLGEPLAASDFKLLDERCRARVGYFADAGLPCREFGR